MPPSNVIGDRYEVFDLVRIADPSGTLYVADFERTGATFKRIYMITDVPRGHTRGGHAHKRQGEYLISVQGSVEVHIEGHRTRAVVPLDRPGRALYLPPGYWRDLLSFSENAVLTVLASDSFDESDYIRDRPAFHRWEREQG